MSSTLFENGWVPSTDLWCLPTQGRLLNTYEGDCWAFTQPTNPAAYVEKSLLAVELSVAQTERMLRSASALSEVNPDDYPRVWLFNTLEEFSYAKAHYMGLNDDYSIFWVVDKMGDKTWKVLVMANQRVAFTIQMKDNKAPPALSVLGPALARPNLSMAAIEQAGQINFWVKQEPWREARFLGISKGFSQFALPMFTNTPQDGVYNGMVIHDSLVKRQMGKVTIEGFE